MYRCTVFTGFGNHERMPDRVSILRFHHLLEKDELAEQMLATVNAALSSVKGLFLKEGTAVDATLVAVPSSTKNGECRHDPEMYQTKKGHQWHFGMKTHIGVDADAGAVHTVVGTATKRKDTQHIAPRWHVAMRSSKRRALDKSTPVDGLLDELEWMKARIRAKAEHPFQVVKRQLVYSKTCYRGLKKNTAQLTLCLHRQTCGCYGGSCWHCEGKFLQNKQKGLLDERGGFITTLQGNKIMTSSSAIQERSVAPNSGHFPLELF